MTLTQAIKASSVIWIHNAEMRLKINKKQALSIRDQADWNHADKDVDYLDGGSWDIDNNRHLSMFWWGT